MPITTTKEILYLHSYENAIVVLSRFTEDLDNAIGNSSHDAVVVAFDTEWPIYFEGDQYNRKQTHGNINIVTLGSQLTDYTIVLELYNFTNCSYHLRAIGQKLKAIFSLELFSITGCHNKSEYSLSRK